ncbi:MAG TPA: NADH-quinone oxidoreductase subunit L, partial [Dehalococcoidales bacterium]|nr:NADH-quinone oxidoreductase subunit L [Dehalococcoidales bacterium]
MSEQLIWLIFLLPVFSFLIISLFIRPLVNKESRDAGYLTIAAIGGSFVLSLMTLSAVLSAKNHELTVPNINWLTIGDLNVRVGLMVDSLTAVMLVVVTLVSLMVQIYSLGYMKDNWDHGDTAYHRYYAWMSLFTASMLGVILSDNLLLIFV